MCEKNYKIISGFKFLLDFPDENIYYALNYKPKDGQKVIVSFPKSGTTWTQQIVYLILNNGIPEKNNKQFVFDSFLEYTGKDSVIEPMVKTHLNYNLMPFNPNAKYLYVVRNPKDVSVSSYHHMKLMYNPEENFHHYFQEFFNDEVNYGDYFEHLLSFVPHLNDPNITYLVYEKMKRNPRKAVLKIAGFLGEEFVAKVKDNNELVLNEVLKHSTVDYMKTDVSKKNEFIIRKGIVGDWRDHYSKDESDLIDQRVKQLLKGTPFENLWDEDMKWH